MSVTHLIWKWNQSTWAQLTKTELDKTQKNDKLSETTDFLDGKWFFELNLKQWENIACRQIYMWK